MRKKVKMDLPENKKINLKQLSSEEDYEVLETYTMQIQKIKEDNDPKPKKKNKKKTAVQILKSITSIISVIVFIIVISTLTINIINNINYKKEETPKEVIKLSSNITGTWQSSTNGLFVFNKDNTFYWYNNHEDLTDNYYKGTYNYKTSNEALTEMGFTEEEFKKEYGSEIKLENIYSINIKPTQVLKNHIDVTSVELDETTTWWYLLIIKEDNSANGFNKTLDLKYNLIKKSD